MARKPNTTNTSPPVEAVKPVDEIRKAETGAEQSAPVANPEVPANVATQGAGDPVISVPVVALVVSARQPLRRRAGRLFTPEPVRIPVAELSDDELAALAGDPMLEVRTETGEAAETLIHVPV